MTMNQFTIVLADTDESYLAQLEKRFIETCQDSANIIIITEEDYLNSFFSTPRNINILVIQEELYSHEFEKHNIASTFILTEQRPEKTGKNTFPKKIYKYTSVKEIYNEVFDTSSLNLLKSDVARSVMVYSPIGGIGKTFTAVGLSVALANAHKKILFLSAEPLQSFSFFLTDPKYLDTGSINQFNARNGPVVGDLDEGKGHEVFDYLLPFSQAASTFGVKLEKYQHYIKSVKENGTYDFIIIDTPADFAADKSAMMASCDKTVLLLGQHPMDVHKFERFLANIDCSNPGKFIFICNKYDGKEKNHILNSTLRTQITICDYIPKLTADTSNFNIEWFAACRYFEKLTYMLL
jgi:cellulose biosynthesis protein BcsQ